VSYISALSSPVTALQTVGGGLGVHTPAAAFY
jgi:hypothetical protein